MKMVAFSDECNWNKGRFKSLAMVSANESEAGVFSSRLKNEIDRACFTELHYSDIGTHRPKLELAKKFIDLALLAADTGKLRLDIIGWDIRDTRHDRPGRDDSANLKRMHYHLFKNVVGKWGSQNRWTIYPDRHESIDWEAQRCWLDCAVQKAERCRSVLEFDSGAVFDPAIVDSVDPKDSRDEPLVQMADLFAGLAVFSRERYPQYQSYQDQLAQQASLFGSATVAASRRDVARFELLTFLNSECKARRLGVSLKTNGRLETLSPKKPLNFWWYTPQNLGDLAPTEREELFWRRIA
jgi:hypothetical protein